MKYVGSKKKHAVSILKQIQRYRASNQWWVEPFVGGGNCISEVGGNRLGSDVFEPTIMGLRAIRDSPHLLPKNKAEFTEDDYLKTKKDPQHELHGYVGFALSYGGKWFGGWCRDAASKRDYVEESYKNAQKQSPKLQGVVLKTCDYSCLDIPTSSIIYCDIPYKGTEQYRDVFDHKRFWKWAREKANQGHRIFVSEYEAPTDFKCIWEKKVNSSLDKNTGRKKAVERLFMLRNTSVAVKSALCWDNTNPWKTTRHHKRKDTKTDRPTMYVGGSLFGSVLEYKPHPTFAYDGAKASMLMQLMPWFPTMGDVYVEPYAGRGSVYFGVKANLSFSRHILNDFQTDRWFKALRKMPEVSVEDCQLNKAEYLDLPSIKRWVLMPPYTWSSGLDSSNSWREFEMNPHKWIDKIKQAGEMLQSGVKILSIDSIAVIKKYGKNPNNFLYIDPPYLGCNVGSYSVDPEHRKKLISTLKRCRSKWVLSEYLCDDLVEAFGPPCYTFIDQSTPGSGEARKARYNTECVWRNFEQPINQICNTSGTRPDPDLLRYSEQFEVASYSDWADECTIPANPAKFRALNNAAHFLVTHDRLVNLRKCPEWNCTSEFDQKA